MQHPGKVLCGAFAWDCVVRDQSDTGLRIQMLSAPPRRAASNWSIWSAATPTTREVVWQKDREFGLKIVSSHDLRGLAPAALQTAKRIWQAGQGRVSAS
jgi:hypothetical protein